MLINPKEVIEQRLASGMGLDRYATIMRSVHTVDVSKDVDFQRTFNGFYMVRRNAEWRKVYYDLFEMSKASVPSFETILTTLYEKTGNLEASFSSKMLATLYPEMPIWDHYVIQNLGLKPKKSLEDIIRTYYNICSWYDAFDGAECIEEFNRVLPSYAWVSNVKKIDFFLWSIR